MAASGKDALYGFILCVVVGVGTVVLFALFAPKFLPLVGSTGAMVTAIGGLAATRSNRGSEGHSATVPITPRRPQANTNTATTNVGCPKCRHVQAVPRSQMTFVCEQCKAHLERGAAPTDSS